MKNRTPPGVVALQPDWCRIEPTASLNGNSSADVYIYDEIGYWGTTARDFAAQVADLDVDEIHLHLNSPGGDAWDGVAIMNTLRRHRARVDVTVDGIAASAASLIAMAGNHITMAPSSMLMIHEASGFAWGNADVMREAAAILDKVSESYADAYAKRAGGTRDEWRVVMKAETWYTAEEAVLAGLADECDESLPAVAHATFRNVKTQKRIEAGEVPSVVDGPIEPIESPPAADASEATAEPEPVHLSHRTRAALALMEIPTPIRKETR